ncbi:MAG: aldolase [bacterium]|nr:aldolase [bacterium]
MTGRQLSETLRAGKRAYGTLVVSTSPHWLGAVTRCNLDFVFIDTEHISIERTTVAWMCQAFKGAGVAPVVRIPAPDPYQAAMVLDGGAAGVVAPYVETPEQARQLRGATKLRPLKGQRLEEALAGKALEEPLGEYLAERNAGNVLFLNIESVPAIEALDDILAVEGIDGVLVGPHDLTCSLGIPEQYQHPKFDEAVRTIISKCRARNVGVGVHAFWDSVDQQVAWAEAGANVILHSGDILLFPRALTEDLGRIRSALGD